MSAHERISIEERLFNLVLALMATSQGLTKAEILSTVNGYRQRYNVAGDNASLSRQFERDKDDIRELGVPLETLDDPSAPANNQLQRYRIPQAAYELPADIHFTPQEIALLELASRVWRAGSLSDHSRRALLKLRSLGDVDADSLIGLAPRLNTRHRAFGPVNEAIDKHLVIEFSYLKPGDDTARRRRIAPLALVQHEARWHLFGYDYDADAERTFLLARVVGQVTVTGTRAEASIVDTGNHGEVAAAELTALSEEHSATLEVTPDTDASVQLARRAKDPAPAGPLTVHYTDLDAFADELSSYGPDVTVLTPPRLRDAVIARLRHILHAHEEARR